jgi:hypothetical protein
VRALRALSLFWGFKALCAKKAGKWQRQ